MNTETKALVTTESEAANPSANNPTPPPSPVDPGNPTDEELNMFFLQQIGTVVVDLQTTRLTKETVEDRFKRFKERWEDVFKKYDDWKTGEAEDRDSNLRQLYGLLDLLATHCGELSILIKQYDIKGDAGSRLKIEDYDLYNMNFLSGLAYFQDKKKDEEEKAAKKMRWRVRFLILAIVLGFLYFRVYVVKM